MLSIKSLEGVFSQCIEIKQKKQTTVLERLPVWVAKSRALVFMVLKVPFPLPSVLWGVHLSVPPGPLHPLPSRWALARARGSYHPQWPHHGHHHLPPPAAGPGEHLGDRAGGTSGWAEPAGCVAGERALIRVPKEAAFPSHSWQEALSTQKALLKEFFTCGPGAVCALTSLYFQERWVPRQGEWVETKPPPSSTLSG